VPNPPPEQAPAFDPEKDLHNFKKMEVAPVPPPKRLPDTASTPFLCVQILRVTDFESLLSMLRNPDHTQLQRACIYAEVTARRAIASDPK
jgi:hypothetical protein